MSYTLDEYWELPTPEELARDMFEANEEYHEPVSEQEISNFLDNYTALVLASTDFNIYSRQGLAETGVDFDIKLRNVDLGEKAPNYNEANDEAFGNYLVEVYFPDQIESFIDHINEATGNIFENDIVQAGRSGGHLVVAVPKLNPMDAIGYGNNTIIEDLMQEFFNPANAIITALDTVQEDLETALNVFATDMSGEREFFESEHGFEREELAPEAKKKEAQVDYEDDEGIRDLETMEKYDPMEDELEPEPDDIYVQDSGPLGGRTSVSAEGKFIGEFKEVEEAEQAIKEWMENNKTWPNIWYVDDHGGIRPYQLENY